MLSVPFGTKKETRTCQTDPRCPPSRSRPPGRKCAWPRTPGTRTIRLRCRWPTPRTAAGARFLQGREAIVTFLQRKWARELDYRLIKELWAFHENRIAVRFKYEWHDDSGNWYRSHGNELWEFDQHGLMRRREASINDVRIEEAERRFLWPQGPRPDDHPGLTEMDMF